MGEAVADHAQGGRAGGRAEAAGERPRGHLAQRAAGHEQLEQLRVGQDGVGALGVGQQHAVTAGLELEDRLLEQAAVLDVRALEQDERAVAQPDGVQLGVGELGHAGRGELSARMDLQRHPARLQRGGDLLHQRRHRPRVDVELVIDVRRGRDRDGPPLDGRPSQGEGVVEGRRTVVDPGKEVEVQVDHAALRPLSAATCREGAERARSGPAPP